MIHSALVSQPEAAAGDTWGIPGPDFLNYYLFAAVAAVIAVVLIRRSATAGAAAIDETSLDPEQVGYLAGYRQQAYYTALTALRSLGLVATFGRGTMAAVAGSSIRLSDLQQTILLVVGPGARTAAVQSDPRLTAPMNRIRDGLRAGGLLMTPTRTARCRLAALVLLVLALIGAARVLSALGNGHPFGNLLAAMIVLGILGLILLAVVPARTTAGTRALSRLRAANGHLRVSQNPAWATYGPMGAGLSVALFGATALFAIDPVFADEARIPRYTGSGGDSGSSGSSDGSSGSSDGGGSSCSGGGCGGGCGG